MKQQLESVRIGHHIIALYESKDARFNEAFSFLKMGLDNNEVAMLITDGMTKGEARDRMRREWTLNVDAFEAAGNIILKTPQEWYFPKNNRPDKSRIVALWWSALAELATIRGKKGLRVVGDVGSFFKHGYASDLIHYETELTPQFEIPMTALCQYEAQDIYGKLPADISEHVKGHHCQIWENSPPNWFLRIQNAARCVGLC
ncbi:MAG: MEDS domain-containing protein [Thermoproteota archaeon]|nr:MEDS domain-containing protein [Thermoproteota archaeon]